MARDSTRSAYEPGVLQAGSDHHTMTAAGNYFGNGLHETNNTTMTTNERFKNDVISGLSNHPKELDPKYFYDAAGDRLFQAIMSCDEYYVTCCEAEIFRQSADAIAGELLSVPGEFDLIELGAGDATKTIFLLKALAARPGLSAYLPVDISGEMIGYLEHRLPQDVPALTVKGFCGEYLDMLQQANVFSNRKKVVLFLGSNIGNMEIDQALQLLRGIRSVLQTGDRLLIGFDLKKDPSTILAAYNDSTGYTEAFNLNLLERINRELGGDFDPAQFEHYPTYDPLSGACRSFLVSKKQQTVRVSDHSFSFREGEVIHMEISQKYDEADIEQLARDSGFSLQRTFMDSRGWFTDVIWECV